MVQYILLIKTIHNIVFIHFSLDELVVNGKNSFTFNSSEELSSKLLSWFDNFPRNEEQKKTEAAFKQELGTFQKLRWRENWNKTAYPVFE